MQLQRTLLLGAAGFMASSIALGLETAPPSWAATPAAHHDPGSGKSTPPDHGSTSGSGSVSNGGDRPAGNNGTIKVDEYVLDSGHDEDAHVSCGFSVSFYGYDGGPQSASISVTPVAPTSGGSTYHTSTSWNIGTRTGGGQFDHNVQVSGSDLSSSLNGVTPQAHQGYHLRLEVEVTGSQGSDDKYKFFWMQPCAPTSPVSSQSAAAASSQSGAATPSRSGATALASSARPSGASNAAAVAAGAPAPLTARAPLALPWGASIPARSAAVASSAPAESRAATASPGPAAAVATASGAAPVPAHLSAASNASAVPAASSKSGALAFTGANVVGLAAGGLLLILTGLLLTSRWRRSAS